MEYNLIRCKYHKEIEGVGASCNSKSNCIYNNYQIIIDGIKGCKVNGHINPSDIPEAKRKQLEEKDLVAKVLIKF